MELFKLKYRGDAYSISGTVDSSDFLDWDAVCDIKATKNGVETDYFGETWIGHRIEADDFFSAILAAYVNEDRTLKFEFVCDDIRLFKKTIQSYKEYNITGKIKKIPAVVITPLGNKAPLRAVSETNAYYIDDDVYVCTYFDGTVASDIEAFVMGGLEADAERGKLIYADEPTKEALIETYEIEEDILP